MFGNQGDSSDGLRKLLMLKQLADDGTKAAQPPSLSAQTGVATEMRALGNDINRLRSDFVDSMDAANSPGKRRSAVSTYLEGVRQIGGEGEVQKAGAFIEQNYGGVYTFESALREVEKAARDATPAGGSGAMSSSRRESATGAMTKDALESLGNLLTGGQGPMSDKQRQAVMSEGMKLGSGKNMTDYQRAGYGDQSKYMEEQWRREGFYDILGSMRPMVANVRSESDKMLVMNQFEERMSRERSANPYISREDEARARALLEADLTAQVTGVDTAESVASKNLGDLEGYLVSLFTGTRIMNESDKFQAIQQLSADQGAFSLYRSTLHNGQMDIMRGVPFSEVMLRVGVSLVESGFVNPNEASSRRNLNQDGFPKLREDTPQAIRTIAGMDPSFIDAIPIDGENWKISFNGLRADGTFGVLSKIMKPDDLYRYWTTVLMPIDGHRQAGPAMGPGREGWELEGRMGGTDVPDAMRVWKDGKK